MGMYDEIKVKHDLPLPEEIKHLNIDWKEVIFQTKDLENLLTEYLIENGELHERFVEREYIEFSEEEKKANRKAKRWFPIYKDVIEKSSHYKKVDNFHGSIVFYHYDELNEKEDFFVDFKADFIYGKLDKIELLKFEKMESRKIYNQQWEIEREKEAKRPWNRFKRYAYRLGWGWFWKIVEKSIHKFESILSSARMFIIRHLL